MIAIVRKELREHAWVLAGCAVLLAFALFALAVSPTDNGEQGSALHGLRRFLLSVYPFLVVVVTSRLVAREYTGRTQLFLETLPVSRATVLSAKLLLGAALSLAAVALALHLFTRLAAQHEVLDRHALAVVSLRTFAYAGCLYAFFFAGGLLGRYRVAILLLICVGLALVAVDSTFKVDEFGPIRLVGPDFAYERTRVPASALASTLALSVVFVGLAYVLALLREGTVSALLAQRMSQREKVAIACVLMGIVFLKTFYDQARGPRPYDLSHAGRAQSSHVVVKVGLGHGVTPERSQQLAERVVSGMGALSTELGFDRLPEIFVLPARDLDPDVYERGRLENASGVVVRANLTAPVFDDDNFVSWISREVVDTATKGRAMEERRRWLLEGFSTDWSLRQATEAGYVQRCSGCHPVEHQGRYLGTRWPELMSRTQWEGRIPEHERVVNGFRMQAYRAAYAFPQGPTTEMLHDWLTTRERHGDCFTSALAWTGIQVLREKLDPPALHRFLHEALARVPSTGLRALSIRESPDSELLRTTGIRMEEVVNVWKDYSARNALGAEKALASVPRLTTTLDLVPVSSTGREARYEVKLAPPPPRPLLIGFITSKLDPFDRPLEWKDLAIDERTYPDHRTGVLPRAYSRGERLAWRSEVYLEDLGCRVISGVRRVEVQ